MCERRGHSFGPAPLRLNWGDAQVEVRDSDRNRLPMA
jgi:hypothetical protein